MNHRHGIIPTSGNRDDYLLLQATCRLTVIDVNAYAVLSQTYACVGRGPQDVTYVFPLPSDAAVCAFSADIDKTRTVRGAVKERAGTRQDNVKDTDDKETALVELPSSQVFEASLRTLGPGQTVVVNIEFVFVIAHTGLLDSLRLQLPVTLAPSCGIPQETLKNHPATSTSAANHFTLSAYFQTTGVITSIDSPTHTIDIDHDGEMTAFVTIWSDKLLESDIVLDVKCESGPPRCIVQRFTAPGSLTVTDAFALRLVPYSFDPLPVPSQEYLVLVDGCGRNDAVRGALHIMLHSLAAKRMRVNVFSSGTHCNSRWPASVEYTARSLKAAIAYVDAMLADRGATDIADALRMVVGSRKKALKRPAVVLLVTDRLAGDTKSVIKLVTDAVDESDYALRFSVLGLGGEVSTEMCDDIARAGGGIASYVHENESPDAKLVNLFAATAYAPVLHQGIEWLVSPDEDGVSNSPPADEAQTTSAALSNGGGQKAIESPGVPELNSTPLRPTGHLQQAPGQLGNFSPFHSNSPCSVFALVQRPRSAPIPTKIILKGTSLGTQVRFEIPVARAASPRIAPDRVPFLHVLAARALVQELEDKGATVPGAADKEQIVRLGTTYGLVSSQTSYVTVDGGGEPVGSAPQDAQSCEPRRLTWSTKDSGGQEGPGVRPTAPTFIHDSATVAPGSSGSPLPTSTSPEHATATSSNAVTLSAIALMQRFDGSFPDIAPLKLRRIPHCPKELLVTVKDNLWKTAKDKLLKPPYDSKDRLWNTILTLAFLERRFRSPDERAAWAFIGAKARKFAREAHLKNQEAGIDKLSCTLEDWLAYAAEALFRDRPVWTLLPQFDRSGQPVATGSGDAV